MPEVVLLLGQFCGFAEMHQVYVYAAFRFSA